MLKMRPGEEPIFYQLIVIDQIVSLNQVLDGRA